LDGHGQILFNEFCDWSAQKNLDLEGDDSDGAENEFAGANYNHLQK